MPSPLDPFLRRYGLASSGGPAPTSGPGFPATNAAYDTNAFPGFATPQGYLSRGLAVPANLGPSAPTGDLATLFPGLSFTSSASGAAGEYGVGQPASAPPALASVVTPQAAPDIFSPLWPREIGATATATGSGDSYLTADPQPGLADDSGGAASLGDFSSRSDQLGDFSSRGDATITDADLGPIGSTIGGQTASQLGGLSPLPTRGTATSQPTDWWARMVDILANFFQRGAIVLLGIILLGAAAWAMAHGEIPRPSVIRHKLP